MDILKKITGVGVVTTRYNITSPKLSKEFGKLKIVHLSDFHCQPKKGILEPIKREMPDIIFMTGDMVDEKKPYGSFLALLKEMVTLAPVYMVSGNHDAGRADFNKFVKACRQLGAVYLQDESREIEIAGKRIVIHGVDDPGLRVGELLEARIEKSLKALKRKPGYEILLFHRANKLDMVKDKGFDLILSGHMHGGQLRIGRKQGVLAPKSGFADSGRMFFPKYAAGYFCEGECQIIVNCGMGNPVPLPRFGNPTEIVSVILENPQL